ncbi:MAG TPA: hypothetical protein VG722_09045 [Tepidisphaeraceae bacterium]|nr:hypothetical protein [Tepidisphaeraceae bacterium]
MFAVIILGIGFIMVAALFPVAIQQTQATSQDVTATAYAQSITQMLPALVDGPHAGNGASYIVPTGDTSLTPPIPPVYASFAAPQAAAASTVFTGVNPHLWKEVSGSLINPINPRYGWVGFYSCDSSSTASPYAAKSYANVIAIITENQNPQASGYVASTDLYQPAGPEPATLQGWPISIKIVDSSDTSIAGLTGRMTSDVVFINDGAVAGSQNAAATGAYIVVAKDNTSATQYWNGRIYRLAARRSDLDVDGPANSQAWELAPGQDFTPENGVTLVNADAFVVGRQLMNPLLPYNATAGASYNVFTGNNQAIAAYTFTMKVQ